jgi:hypothetical protein
MLKPLRIFIGSSALSLALSASILPAYSAATPIPGAGNGNLDMAKPIPQPVAVDPPAPAQPTPGTPFTVTAGAKRSEYKAGKPIELEIEIKNTSKDLAEIQFSSSQRYNFFATREGETEPSWNWSANRSFAQAVGTEKIALGGSIKFKDVWENATPGTYTVSAVITGNGGLNAPPFTLIVK